MGKTEVLYWKVEIIKIFWPFEGLSSKIGLCSWFMVVTSLIYALLFHNWMLRYFIEDVLQLI